MSSKLYVGNLPYSTTDDSLKEMFAKCGTVESASVITDKYSGQSKGFGFVEMSSKQEATEAIAKLNGSQVDGRALNVAEAKPQAPRDNSGSGRGYGGGANRRW
jgi:RNA recognition motif-containing protein